MVFIEKTQSLELQKASSEPHEPNSSASLGLSELSGFFLSLSHHVVNASVTFPPQMCLALLIHHLPKFWIFNCFSGAPPLILLFKHGTQSCIAVDLSYEFLSRAHSGTFFSGQKRPQPVGGLVEHVLHSFWRFRSFRVHLLFEHSLLPEGSSVSHGHGGNIRDGVPRF